MKLTSLLPPAAAVALLAAAVLATTTGVQAKQDQPQAAAPAAQTPPAPPAGHPMRNLPAPTNLQVRDDGFRVTRILVTRRIGIRHAVELPLRFSLPESKCVSGPKKIKGKSIFLREGSVRKLMR